VARNAAFTAMEIGAVAELYPAQLTIGLGHGMAGWMRQIGAYPRSPLTVLAEHIQAAWGDRTIGRADHPDLSRVRHQLRERCRVQIGGDVRG
jgi:5,10-methylenetetrahydromethanopterin reductase